MNKTATLAALAALALPLAAPARAAEPAIEDTSAVSGHTSPAGTFVPMPTVPKELKGVEQEPFPVSLFLHNLPRGMLVRLPMIDTDPNRGFTFGFLPVWIINASTEDRIEHMIAPSLTYNPTFKVNATGRYFYYPDKDSTLMMSGTISQVVEKELFLQYDNTNLFNMFGEWGVKTQWTTDASPRFYGFGPTTSSKGSASYVLNTLNLDSYFGLPFARGSHWYWTAEHRVVGNKIGDGPVKGIPGITALYPGVVPGHFHQTSALRAYVTYDTLDNSVTTTSGTYAESFIESSQRSFASEYAFQRYSVDLRRFLPRGKDARYVTAARLKFEQVLGDAPLWLLPALGGKYTFPAYGDGRYVTRGVLAAIVEERVTVFRIDAGGVTTKFEVAPSVGLGSAFDVPRRMNARYARPLFGLGLRAVAPPQVVGSIDIGFGQEGASTFMDINYPF